MKNSVIRRFRNERRIDGRKVGEQSVVKAELGRGEGEGAEWKDVGERGEWFAGKEGGRGGKRVRLK